MHQHVSKCWTNGHTGAPGLSSFPQRTAFRESPPPWKQSSETPRCRSPCLQWPGCKGKRLHCKSYSPQPISAPGHARPFPCLVDPDGPWTARFTRGSRGFSSDCDSHEVRECDILVGELHHYMQAGCTRSPLTRKPVKKLLKQIKEAGVPKLASSSSVGRISMLCMKRA